MATGGLHEKPNATGKGRPPGLAEASDGVSVPLTAKLGWGAKWKSVEARTLPQSQISRKKLQQLF
jgi:hypothetical protein